MRSHSTAFCLFALACWPAQAGLAQQPEPPSARPLVEKAVQAMGGLDKLTSGQGSIRKVKGKHPGETFFGTTWAQHPDLFKLDSRPTPNGKTDCLLLLKGGKGWFRIQDKIITLEAEELALLKRASHADKVAGLVTLLKDPGFTLLPLGESKIKEQTVLGVLVRYKGQPDIHLFFNKENGLLVKSWQKFKETGHFVGAGFIVHESYYSQYMILDPVQQDKKQLQAAKLRTDATALAPWLALRTISADDRATIAALVKGVGSNSFTTRSKATAQLKKFGPEAAHFVKMALSSSDSEVVLRARQCLDHYAADPALVQIPAALRVIAHGKPAGAAAVLLDYLHCAPNAEIQEELQAALFDLAQGSKADTTLVKALDDADPARRAAAAAALGKDGGVYAKLPGRRLLIDGLKLAGRCELYRDGKLEMTLDVLEMQYFNSLDEKLFELPN